MSSIPIGSVNFSLGQGLDYTDFNAMQLYHQTIASDFLFSLQCPNGQRTGHTPSSVSLYAHGNGAYPYVAAYNDIRSTAGLLSQQVAPLNGTEWRMLHYWCGADEISFPASSFTRDATNPRWAVIGVKLSLQDTVESRDFKDAATGVVTSQSTTTRRMVRLDKQVKLGTPAANANLSTASSLLDTGYVPWAALLLTPTSVSESTIADTNPHLCDLRVPLGVRTLFVSGRQTFDMTTGAAYSGTTYNGGIKPAGATNLGLVVPNMAPSSRLIGLEVLGEFAAATTMTLMGLTYNSVSTPLLRTGVSTRTYAINNAASTDRYWNLLDAANDIAYTTSINTTQTGGPFWGLGTRARSVSDAPQQVLALNFSLQANDVLIGARFYVAG